MPFAFPSESVFAFAGILNVQHARMFEGLFCAGDMRVSCSARTDLCICGTADELHGVAAIDQVLVPHALSLFIDYICNR